MYTRSLVVCTEPALGSHHHSSVYCRGFTSPSPPTDSRPQTSQILLLQCMAGAEAQLRRFTLDSYQYPDLRRILRGGIQGGRAYGSSNISISRDRSVNLKSCYL